jgi:hypothetical protein
MAEKYFNRHEAEELLPVIGQFLEGARKQKHALDSITAEISNAALRIMMLGGSLPPNNWPGRSTRFNKPGAW